MWKANQKHGRLKKRRVDKAHQQSSVADIFERLYKIDIGNLLHEDLMSDSDSEPELDAAGKVSNISRVVWRHQMLQYLRYTGPVENHEDVAILEVVRPAWCSQMWGDILHELTRIYCATLTPAERRNVKYRRVSDSYQITQLLAATVPYDFMINEEWLKDARETHKALMSQWMKFGNPPGFNLVPYFRALALLLCPLPDGSDKTEEGSERGEEKGDEEEGEIDDKDQVGLEEQDGD
ncbi:hypothetical protein K439DRAFT_1619161 [Ramaria rubella]|nr:hypothetical protein K439DRAFT_1619161 [Ramaria rubella]